MSDIKDSINLMARLECHCNPQQAKLHKGDYVKNAQGTHDDHPAYGDSWIIYWGAFTKHEVPDLCPLCGDPIVKGKADGCHVLIKPQGKDDYDTTEYIIPGHHDCNCRFCDEFVLKKDITAVEAKKKTTLQESPNASK